MTAQSIITIAHVLRCCLNTTNSFSIKNSWVEAPNVLVVRDFQTMLLCGVMYKFLNLVLHAFQDCKVCMLHAKRKVYNRWYVAEILRRRFE